MLRVDVGRHQVRPQQQRVQLAQLERLEPHQAAARLNLQLLALRAEDRVEVRPTHVARSGALAERVRRLGRRVARRLDAVLRVGEPRRARRERVDRLAHLGAILRAQVVRALVLEQQLEHRGHADEPRAQVRRPAAPAAERRPGRERLLLQPLADLRVGAVGPAAVERVVERRLAGRARLWVADDVEAAVRGRVALGHHLPGDRVAARVQRAKEQHAGVGGPEVAARGLKARRRRLARKVEVVDELAQLRHSAAPLGDHRQRVHHVPHAVGVLVARGKRVVADARLARPAPQRLAEDGVVLVRRVGQVRPTRRAADLLGRAEAVAQRAVGRRLHVRAQRLRHAAEGKAEEAELGPRRLLAARLPVGLLERPHVVVQHRVHAGDEPVRDAAARHRHLRVLLGANRHPVRLARDPGRDLVGALGRERVAAVAAPVGAEEVAH